MQQRRKRKRKLGSNEIVEIKVLDDKEKDKKVNENNEKEKKAGKAQNNIEILIAW